MNNSQKPDTPPGSRKALVIGGAVLDRKYHARQPLIAGTSNPVDGYRSFGGVARNMAENLLRLGSHVGFVSMVGDDEAGRALIRSLADLGADTDRVTLSADLPTAEYAAILGPDGEMSIAAADMRIFDLMTPDWLMAGWRGLGAGDWMLADCNPMAPTLAALAALRRSQGFRLAVNTVSAPKALRLPADLDGIDLLFTNLDEANAILARSAPDDWLSPEPAARDLVQRGAQAAIVTAGAAGYAIAQRGESSIHKAIVARPVDITGAGDAMVAGTFHRLLQGDDLAQAARFGALVAALTVETDASVRPDLSPELVAQSMHRLIA